MAYADEGDRVSLIGFRIHNNIDPGDMVMILGNYRVKLIQRRGDDYIGVWGCSELAIPITAIIDSCETVEVLTTVSCSPLVVLDRGGSHVTAGPLYEGCTVDEIVQTKKPAAYCNCNTSAMRSAGVWKVCSSGKLMFTV